MPMWKAWDSEEIVWNMTPSKFDPFFHMFMLDLHIDTSPGPPMDAEVWSQMPFDMLEKVLLRVPFASQARFRTVSKAVLWMLSTEPFQLEASKIGVACGRLPICAFVRSDVLSKDGVAVIPELQVPYKVHKLSLGFLPAEFRAIGGLRSSNIHSGKGVLFLPRKLLNDNGRVIGHKICMVNPFNRTWRQLPDLVVRSISLELPQFDALKTVSLMGEDDGGFEVFVLHSYMPEKAHYMGDPLYAYASVYRSRTHSWKSKFITYKRPLDQVTLAQAWVAVGHENLYALGKVASLAGRHIQLEIFGASSARTMRPLASPPFRVDTYELGLVNLEQKEILVAVPTQGGTCKVLSLADHKAENWDEVSALPKELAKKMAPSANFDTDYQLAKPNDAYFAGEEQFPHLSAPSWVMNSQVAGTFLVISLSVKRKGHVAVYDYRLGTWKTVLSHFWNGETSEAPRPWERALDSSNFRGIMYLQPRPNLRLGMADYPPDTTNCK